MRRIAALSLVLLFDCVFPLKLGSSVNLRIDMSLLYNDVACLETYNVDTKKISLSGFSSGGFFAVQFHVAFSETIMGAGIAAGGEY